METGIVQDLRRTALAGLTLNDRRILEIGPLDRPIVGRSASPHVFYLDHCSTEALRAKYRDDPVVNKNAIVDVDFVAADGSVSDATIGTAKFDLIVAAHVIEHVPNLVGWLSDIASALNEGGTLALVVPDRRYTFDRFRRLTPRHWIREAAVNNYQRPGLRNVVDHFSNAVRISSADVWEGKDVSDAPHFHDAGIVQRATNDWQVGAYIDCHSWVFESDSFPDLVGWIAEEFGVPLRLAHLVPPIRGQLEFYAQLRKL